MDIKKAIDKIKSKVLEELLAGRYKLIEKGEYTSKLEYGKSTLEIWTANGKSSCKIYGEPEGLKFEDNLTDEQKSIVWKIATTKTDYMIKRKLREANKAKKKAFETYKEKRTEVQLLKDQLNPPVPKQ